MKYFIVLLQAMLLFQVTLAEEENSFTYHFTKKQSQEIFLALDVETKVIADKNSYIFPLHRHLDAFYPSTVERLKEIGVLKCVEFVSLPGERRERVENTICGLKEKVLIYQTAHSVQSESCNNLYKKSLISIKVNTEKSFEIFDNLNKEMKSYFMKIKKVVLKDVNGKIELDTVCEDQKPEIKLLRKSVGEVDFIWNFSNPALIISIRSS